MTLSRRHFLKVGALTLGGMGLQGVMPWKLRATEAGDASPETAVILVWLPGGPLGKGWARRSGTPASLLKPVTRQAGHA